LLFDVFLCSGLGSSAGVEECVDITMLLSKSVPILQTKLVKFPDINWEDDFEDEEINNGANIKLI